MTANLADPLLFIIVTETLFAAFKTLQKRFVHLLMFDLDITDRFKEPRGIFMPLFFGNPGKVSLHGKVLAAYAANG